MHSKETSIIFDLPERNTDKNIFIFTILKRQFSIESFDLLFICQKIQIWLSIFEL